MTNTLYPGMLNQMPAQGLGGQPAYPTMKMGTQAPKAPGGQQNMGGLWHKLHMLKMAGGMK